MGSAPCVSLGITRSNGALGDRGNTIHLVGVVLTNTVPVNSRSVVGHVVGDMDNDSVTPVCNDGGARNGAVDSEDNTLPSIRGSSDVLDVEPVFPGHTSIWYLVIVVGANVVVSPASSVGSTVDTSL